jgi:hypothetical protein
MLIGLGPEIPPVLSLSSYLSGIINYHQGFAIFRAFLYWIAEIRRFAERPTISELRERLGRRIRVNS